MDRCQICKKDMVKNVLIKNRRHQHLAFNRLLKKLCQHCQLKTTKKLGPRPTKKAIRQIYAKINGLLTSVEVRQIRKKLQLTQKEAARICGGGPNAFSRYERGETIPIRATSNLLRVLNRHPEEVQHLLALMP